MKTERTKKGNTAANQRNRCSSNQSHDHGKQDRKKEGDIPQNACKSSRKGRQGLDHDVIDQQCGMPCVDACLGAVGED